MQGKALKYASFGDPAEVLSLEQVEIAKPESGNLLVKVLAAPVHPSDLGMISGRYGVKPDLPAIGGREGLGEIIGFGEGVDGYSIGERVRIPSMAGSWQTHVQFPARGVMRIPTSIPIEQAAMASVNPPTAWRMLRDAHLEEGDWVIQNASNSAVGIHVIQMARHLGLKTINTVRRAELIEPLKEIGADVVVVEDSGFEKEIKDLTQGGRVRLALNAVGGESAIRQIKSLDKGGVHVTYGGASFETVRFPTRFLIFNDIHLRGFWMDAWYRGQSEARIDIMMGKVFDLMEKGIVEAPIAGKFPLEAYADALKAQGEPRLGKVLFVPNPN